MRVIRWLLPLVAVVPLVSCTGGAKDRRAADTGTGAAARGTGDEEEATIRQTLAKLSPEDRKLAEEQKYCAVQTGNRLGEMGTPVKILVKDQPVFLCCRSCKEKAEADPEKTLATVRELKAKAAASPKG
jgi:hypothetical protein